MNDFNGIPGSYTPPADKDEIIKSQQDLISSLVKSNNDLTRRLSDITDRLLTKEENRIEHEKQLEKEDNEFKTTLLSLAQNTGMLETFINIFKNRY